MPLVDTSVWVEYLRATGSPAHLELQALLRDRPEDVVMTEPVGMELLSAPTDPVVAGQLERLVDGLPLVRVHADLDFRAAAAAARAARIRGRTVRSLLDCLIAVVAVRADVELWHRDRDFLVLADCLAGLRLRSL